MNATDSVLPVLTREVDDDPPPPKNPIKIRRHVIFPDPDEALNHTLQMIDTKIVDINAKLIERCSDGSVKTVHYKSLADYLGSETVKRRIKQQGHFDELREVAERLKESGLRESHADEFRSGFYPDEIARARGELNIFPSQDTILPSTNSPAAKQMLFADYLDMHRKAFEASVRNPLGKRIVKIIPQFVLGRGVIGIVADAESATAKESQSLWDEFWLRNKMKFRIKLILRELITYGEVFLRYFRRPEGLVIRSIDPSTIWDIVTDLEDIENIRFYHQQFTAVHRGPFLSTTKAPPATLIIRQIPPEEIDHFKINATSSEKRGRSELYAVLSWLIRVREFANDRVLLNKMRAMFALDVAVEGGQAEVDAAEEQFAVPPGPGSVLIHNKSAEIGFKSTSTDSTDAKTDADMLLRMVAVGAGVSEQFLGVANVSTRAGALIQTEPDVKNFEDYQELVEEMLQLSATRVFINSRRKGRRATRSLGLVTTLSSVVDRMEFTFPAIAQEDRSAKIKDLIIAQTAQLFSQRRVANMAAREFQITTFDFDAEKEDIRKEQAELEAKLAAQMGAPGEPRDKKVTQTSAQMGFPAGGPRPGGRGLPNTQATLNRGAFTRGGEKRSIQGRKSAGAPLRAALPPEDGQPKKKRGWTPEARQAAILARRKKTAEKKRRQS